MTAHTKLAQNEMALQMYQLGVLDPGNSDKALALLDIMDFGHKDAIEDKVRQNGTMYQMLAMYQQIAMQLAIKHGEGEVAEGLAQTIMGAQQAAPQQGGGIQGMSGTDSDNVQGLRQEEHAFVRKSRQQTQASTIPNA